MAKAVAITEMVSKKVTVITCVPEVRRVELELSKDEAEVLALILGQIGGHPGRTRRALADKIQLALFDVGFNWEDIDPDAFEPGNRALYFKDGV